MISPLVPLVLHRRRRYRQPTPPLSPHRRRRRRRQTHTHTHTHLPSPSDQHPVHSNKADPTCTRSHGQACPHNLPGYLPGYTLVARHTWNRVSRPSLFSLLPLFHRIVTPYASVLLPDAASPSAPNPRPLRIASSRPSTNHPTSFGRAGLCLAELAAQCSRLRLSHSDLCLASPCLTLPSYRPVL